MTEAVFPSNFGIYCKDTKKGSDPKAADTSVLPMRMKKRRVLGGVIPAGGIRKKREAYPDGVHLRNRKIKACDVFCEPTTTQDTGRDGKRSKSYHLEPRQ